MTTKSQLPRFERRPTASYYLGQSISRGCFTSSLLVNLFRLLTFGYALGAGLSLLGGSALALPTGVAVLLFLATFAYRPRPPKAALAPDTWSPKEQRLARVVSESTTNGQPLDEVLELARLRDELAIDYGTTAADGRSICVAQKLRHAHQVTVGGAGSGKSKFIATQALQGVIAGSSIAVIDPHEELCQDILCAGAPLLTERGCIVLWPGGPTRRIYPWNPLWTGPGREAWQAADLVVGAVKRIWQLSDKNTFIIDVLKHTCWALAGAGWTLLEGPRFLTEEAFRDYITERANLPQVTQWVRRYNGLAQRDRDGIAQATLVRLNRLHGNPHLMRMFGAGVTDPRYCEALRAQGLEVVAGADLIGAINGGHHLFTVLPKRAVGEDQYLIAGLVQASLLSAALSRRPNDPAMTELEMYLDEAAAYANAEGLGRILAEARKFKATAIVAMQGLGQAEPELVKELRLNTAIKTIMATDDPEEAEAAAQMLFSFDPTAIKMDVRQRFKAGEGDRRETGFFQTYNPQEQHAFGAGQIIALKPRHYFLKIRGEEGTPLLAITPTYTSRYELREALQTAMRRRVATLVNEDVLDRELAARHAWLEAQSYAQARPHMKAPSIEDRPHLVRRSATAAEQDRMSMYADDGVQLGQDTSCLTAATRAETRLPEIEEEEEPRDATTPAPRLHANTSDEDDSAGFAAASEDLVSPAPSPSGASLPTIMDEDDDPEADDE